MMLTVDTNIMIGIANIMSGRKECFGNYDEYLNYLTLAYLLQDREIELVIPPTVFNEIIKGFSFDGGMAETIIKKFCVLTKFDSDEKKLSRQLAYEYGNELCADKNYALDNAKTAGSPNYNDALIIAETCVLQQRIKRKLGFLSNDKMHVLPSMNNVNEINAKHNVIPITMHDITYVEKIAEISQFLASQNAV